ncbi:MAG: hypothetical protein H6704_10410 [Myxococcales bacterium]|nr:hypothetical protein [Myxococcales bacterium]
MVPALGESPADVADLFATLRDAPGDVVVDGTMIDLQRLLPPLKKRWVKVRYELDPATPEVIEGTCARWSARRAGAAPPPPGVIEAAGLRRGQGFFSERSSVARGFCAPS